VVVKADQMATVRVRESMTQNSKYEAKELKGKITFLACGKHVFDSHWIEEPGWLSIAKIDSGNAYLWLRRKGIRFSEYHDRWVYDDGSPMDEKDTTAMQGKSWPRCEQVTQSGTRCREPATYIVNFESVRMAQAELHVGDGDYTI
jgi:hypothetical protein